MTEPLLGVGTAGTCGHLWWRPYRLDSVGISLHGSPNRPLKLDKIRIQMIHVYVKSDDRKTV